MAYLQYFSLQPATTATLPVFAPRTFQNICEHFEHFTPFCIHFKHFRPANVRFPHLDVHGKYHQIVKQNNFN